MFIENSNLQKLKQYLGKTIQRALGFEYQISVLSASIFRKSKFKIQFDAILNLKIPSHGPWNLHSKYRFTFFSIFSQYLKIACGVITDSLDFDLAEFG